jgi:tRNA (cmo5U34)-methyltransferase
MVFIENMCFTYVQLYGTLAQGVEMDAVEKFGTSRAAEYGEQSKIALAGYEACHELTACLLSAVVGEGTSARILVVGAGGPGLEVITAGTLETLWSFVAVEPSEPMLAMARESITKAGFGERTTFHQGYLDEREAGEPFDAAVMFGVFHHISGDEEKQKLVDTIARCLKPGAPFFLSGNRYKYSERPVFLKAWGNRWRLRGWSPEVVAKKLATIVEGAAPPGSEEEVEAFLDRAGFRGHTKYFSSLFWGSWMTFKR